MTPKEWFAYWDANHKKFEWIFEQYGFRGEWERLIIARDNEHQGVMKTLLNRIWFMAPGHIFNIRRNPTGWKEILELLAE